MGFRVLDSNGIPKAPLLGTPMLLGSDPWHNVGAAGQPAFQNGWVNGGAGNPPVAFRKYPDGRVRVRGYATTGTTGTAVFTLPSGYWPPTGTGFIPIIADGSPAGAWLQVSATGAFTVNRVTGAGAYFDYEFDTDTVTQAPVMFGVPLVTSLAGLAPVEGMLVDYLVDATNNIIWNLRYRVGVGWVWRGGDELSYHIAGGVQTITSLNPTWADLPTGGFGATQGITAPNAGSYVIRLEASMDNAADGQQIMLGVKPGAGVTQQVLNHRTGNWTDDAKTWLFTGVTAGMFMKLQSMTTSSGARVLSGDMYLRPRVIT